MSPGYTPPVVTRHQWLHATSGYTPPVVYA